MPAGPSRASVKDSAKASIGLGAAVASSIACFNVATGLPFVPAFISFPIADTKIPTHLMSMGSMARLGMHDGSVPPSVPPVLLLVVPVVEHVLVCSQSSLLWKQPDAVAG